MSADLLDSKRPPTIVGSLPESSFLFIDKWLRKTDYFEPQDIYVNAPRCPRASGHSLIQHHPESSIVWSSCVELIMTAASFQLKAQLGGPEFEIFHRAIRYLRLQIRRLSHLYENYFGELNLPDATSDVFPSAKT